MPDINLTNDQMINELRARGLYLYVLGPNDFKEYELDGPGDTVEMTDAEAVQLVSRSSKTIDAAISEHVWDVVGDYVRQFQSEKSSENNS